MRIPLFTRRQVAIAVGTALVAAPLAAAPASANVTASTVVISEVYGGGGNASAPLNQDFVELYNPTASAVSLAGLSVQYRSATGVASPSGVVVLTGSIPSHGHYLVGGATGTVGSAIPTPDVTSTVNLSGTTGTVFLAAQSTALTAPPTGSITGNPSIIDLVGFGTSNTFETTVAPAASNTTSISRTPTGADSDVNSTDFSAGMPTPQNVADGGGSTDPEPPADPVAKTIEQIQGTTDTSPLVGTTVITTGVVTATYASGGFNGYYIQVAGTGGALDAGHDTSDAVFVYSPSTVASVAVGDNVSVTGPVSEFSGMTEITVSSAAGLEKSAVVAAAPQPVTSEVPLAASGREALEGMLVAPAGDFTITDNYDTNYYGSIVLNPGTSPLITPTQVVDPGAPAIALAAQNLARVITLDDGASINFNSAANQDIELPYLSNANPVRIGAAVTFTRPVIFDYRNSGWNFQPTTQLTTANASTVQPATFENTRTAAPNELGGDVTFASFNVLNYFTDTGDSLAGCSYYTDRDGNPITVNTGCDARGAATAASLKRQQDKIVAAINRLGADVVSLEEIENSSEVVAGKDRDSALSTLVAALNSDAGTDTWGFAPSPTALPAQQDVIRTAFIYKKAVLKPVGISVVLDDPAFVNARQPLAQQFELAGGDASSAFLAIVNHFKSKGSAGPLVGDADSGDGQGASNASRVAQAKALVAFANTMKTATGVGRVFLSGDFNAYLKEDPIKILQAAGYTDLGSRTGKYTYAFDGAVGSLDHIFASTDAAASVTGVDEWNINSVESIALEYSRYNYNALNLYRPDQYRASDHDPILVGFTLTTPPVTTPPVTVPPVTTPPVTTPPLPTLSAASPMISGKDKVGATLEVTTGKWQPAPVKLSIRWLRNGNPIAGATHNSYTLKKADKGNRISVRVTGTKTGYPTVVTVSASEKIYLSLARTPKPRVTGTVKVGKRLAIVAGKWTPTKVSLHYRWYRNGKAIKGANAKSYTLTKADRGEAITARVTGTKKGYLPETTTSAGKRVK